MHISTERRLEVCFLIQKKAWIAIFKWSRTSSRKRSWFGCLEPVEIRRH